MAARVTLYTIPDCPFCSAKRQELDGRAVSYTEIDVRTHPERVAELMKLTGGRRVVPVLVEGGSILVAPDGGSSF